jgi:hypothetical protein
MDSGVEKKLSDLTQQEFDELIKQQKESPKTVEDIARAQLKSSDAAKAALESINKAYYNGVVSARFVRDNIDAINKAATITTGALSERGSDTEAFRNTFEKIFTSAQDKIQKAVGGEDVNKIIKETLAELESGSKGIKSDLLGYAKSTLEKLGESKGQVGGNSFIAKQYQDFMNRLETEAKNYGVTSTQGKSTTAAKVEPVVSSILFGNQQQALQNYVLSENKTEIKESKNIVDFTGEVTFKVVTPPGMSSQKFEEYIISDEFKKLVYNHWLSKSKELERTK